MTCIVSSAWHPLHSTHGWSPMNPDDSTHAGSGIDRPLYGYASSESETRPAQSGGGKKRASRAGTRSVTTLSAAQLERKRANDREAQRAIRQRTKDHIETLERNISDLRAANDASEKMATVAHQRARELEDENAYLRTKLGEVGYPMAVPPDNHRQDPNLLSVHGTSPSAQTIGSSIPRPDSTSTPRSTLSINTSHSSNSRHGSWQQGPTSGFSVTSVNTPASLPAHSGVQLGSGLTSWRSHDSPSGVPNNPGDIHDHSPLPPQTSYHNPLPADRQQWGVSPSYAYSDLQRTPSVHGASPQPQPQFPQAPISGYTPTNAPPPTSYVTPPQNEFSNMAVNSPPGYPIQQQQTYGQQPHYQISPLQVQTGTNSGEYVTQAQMQPPLMATAGYPGTSDGKSYSQPQIQQTMQYRETADSRGYSLTHYSSG